MFDKVEFSFASASGMADIHAAKYLPMDGDIRAIVQISHGMAEHFERYEPFIDVLCSHGIAVFTNDHQGHGGSVAKEDDKGYFGPKGWQVMVDDLHTVYTTARKVLPDTLPYFIFGHSMGSFVAREYCRRYGNELAGAIICGTGGSNPAAGLGIGIAKMIASAKGDHHRSKFIDNLAFGTYNKRIDNPRTSFDWLTRDNDIVDAYIADPDCGYLFTVNGFIGLFSALQTVSRDDWYNGVRQDLPMLLIAGDQDPVGAYGKGVKQVHDKLISTGHTKVSMRLYAGARHEILNESQCFDTVAGDILAFVDQNIN